MENLIKTYNETKDKKDLQKINKFSEECKIKPVEVCFLFCFII